jgi:hypothetical protein
LTFKKIKNKNMDQQNQNLQPQALPQKHFKSFWPIMSIVVLSAIVGGILVWAAYNSGLDDELNSLLPGSARSMMHRDKKVPQQVETSSSTEGWQTYKNDKYGFEFKYPADAKLSIQNDQQKIQCGEFFDPTGCIKVDVFLDANTVISVNRAPRYDLSGKTVVIGEYKILDVPQKVSEEKYFWTSLDNNFDADLTTLTETSDHDLKIFTTLLQTIKFTK